MTGFRTLLRASLRHDGRLVMPWAVIIMVLSTSSHLVYPLVFPTSEERLTLAATIGANPALGLVFGPAVDLSTDTGFNTWRSLALGGFLAGLGAILTVLRATRGQEDSGQAELLASGVLSRAARLGVGLAMGVICALLTGVIPLLFTMLCGGEWASTGLLCATFTVTALMCTGIAAVCGELAGDRRSASTMAVGTLGALYVLRGLSYSLDAPTWTLWANPLGWMTETDPAVTIRWWPLLPGVCLALAGCVLALVLQQHRDFGQGVIVPGAGPATGRIRTVAGLVTRLNRGPLLVWTIVACLLGTVFGYFTASVGDILSGNELVQRILASGATSEAELTGTFLVTILSLLGIIMAVPGVQAMLKVHSEENEDRVEPLIATAVSRRRFFGTNVVAALGTTTWCLLVSGALVAIVGHGIGAPLDLGDSLAQVLVTVPASWAVVAISVAVVGRRPPVIVAAWIGVLISFGITLLGPTFKFPDWALSISPFHHVPNMTGNPAWTGLGIVTAVAIVLCLLGTVAFSRRDLARD